MEAAAWAMVARNLMDRFGFDIARQDSAFLEPEFTAYHARCAPFTMVSRERLYAHFLAVRYVVENKSMATSSSAASGVVGLRCLER
jgi:hypothetical protein